MPFEVSKFSEVGKCEAISTVCGIVIWQFCQQYHAQVSRPLEKSLRSLLPPPLCASVGREGVKWLLLIVEQWHQGKFLEGSWAGQTLWCCKILLAFIFASVNRGKDRVELFCVSLIFQMGISAFCSFCKEQNDLDPVWNQNRGKTTDLLHLYVLSFLSCKAFCLCMHCVRARW